MPLAPASRLAGRLGVPPAFLKFLLVGGAAFFVNQFALYMLYDSPLAEVFPGKDASADFALFVHPDSRLVIATVLAVEVAILFKFVWAEGWIFHDRRPEGSVMGRLLHFNVSCAASAGVTVAVTNLVTVQMGISPYLATPVGVLAGFMLNWVWAASVVWPEKPRVAEPGRRAERGSA